MAKCIICNKKTDNVGLCPLCKENPFYVERLRDFLSKDKDLVNFKNTYSNKFVEIKNKNNKKFWNEKFLLKENEKNTSDKMTEEKQKIIINFLKKKSGKLLDFGIGLGGLEKKLIKVNNNISIFGIDTSDYAIKKVSEEIKGNFFVTTILKFKNKNKFDITICLEVLEHIPPSKIMKVLKKINLLTKKGGFFICSVPMNEGLDEMLKNGVNPNGHVRTYTEDILKLELEINGFTLLKKEIFFAFRNKYFLKSFIVKKIFKNLKKPNNLLIISTKN